MYRPHHPGALVISLDFEIYWGLRDIFPPHSPYRPNLLGVWQAVPQMLDLFETFNVAATWATVGFLFASSYQELERFFPDQRPAYVDAALSPYSEPTNSTHSDAPLYFAPELITAIASRPHQEIGTHTFSHYYCLEPGQTRADFRADLASAQAIAQQAGFHLRSIAFPRNQANPNYLDLLAEAGLVSYRGNERAWMYRAVPAAQYQRPTERFARLLDSYLFLSGFHLTAWDDLLDQHNLCNVRSSAFLRPWTPASQRLDALRLRRIVQGLEAAAVSRKIFHLWWHPHNFGTYTAENLAFLRHIFEAFAHCRTRYGMRSLNMADVADTIHTC